MCRFAQKVLCKPVQEKLGVIIYVNCTNYLQHSIMKNLTKLLLILLFSQLLSSCQPQENGQLESTSTSIDRLMKHCNENGLFNGTVLVAQNNEVIYRKALGYANLETEDPLTPESAFYLASVSKQFTTMAIMILKERGLITYEDKLSDHFPEFPSYAQSVTIRHMMNHTSGIPDHYRLNAYKPDLKNSDVFELLIVQDSLDFSPGDEYSYSNGAYVLLSMIVEKVAEEPFHTFMKSNIFDPLEMNSTLVFDESKPTVSNRAIGYNAAGELDDYEILTLGAGGMFSNLDDLFRWEQSLYTDKLISQETLSQAFKVTTLNDGEISTYGFGWGVNKEENTVQHSGGLSGYRTYLKRYLNTQDSYILLTNMGDAVAMGEINNALNNILNGKTFELPKVPISSKLRKFLKEGDTETAFSQARELLKSTEVYQADASGVNSLGYSYLADNNKETAVAVFGFNIELAPGVANSYDSMGEVLLTQGDTTAAIENYRKSIELNPNNQNAVDVLTSLGESMIDVEVNVSSDILQTYVGKYELNPDLILTIFIKEGRLFTQATGQSEVELFPASETRFYLKVVDAQVTFNKDEAGQVSNLTLHQGGDQKALRIE